MPHKLIMLLTIGILPAIWTTMTRRGCASHNLADMSLSCRPAEDCTLSIKLNIPLCKTSGNSSPFSGADCLKAFYEFKKETLALSFSRCGEVVCLLDYNTDYILD